MPYGRDAGMDETQARRIADAVRAAGLGEPIVEREGHYFVVAVETAASRQVLRDEADWRWLQAQRDVSRPAAE